MQLGLRAGKVLFPESTLRPGCKKIPQRSSHNVFWQVTRLPQERGIYAEYRAI